MEMKTKIDPGTLKWLLEKDEERPGVRYFALKEILGLPEDSQEVREALAANMLSGPVPVILANQQPEGYWAKPGSGYGPKYQSTVWQIIFLADLGADPQNEQVRRGCEYLIRHTLSPNGTFSTGGGDKYELFCLAGNLIYALISLGFGDDPRILNAVEWNANTILKGAYPGCYSQENFICAINESKPCAWGATKIIKAFLKIPEEQRSLAVRQALKAGETFFMSCDPAKADYPYTNSVNPIWFNLHYPSGYWSDILEVTSLLVDLGYAHDPFLYNALELILQKQDKSGLWPMEQNKLMSKMWTNIDRQGKPSKWITLRVLRMLNKIDPIHQYL